MGQIKVEKVCISCGKHFSFLLDEEKYRKLLDRELHVQDAFPELYEDERELFLSGLCGNCFDDLFSEDE